MKSDIENIAQYVHDRQGYLFLQRTWLSMFMIVSSTYSYREHGLACS